MSRILLIDRNKVRAEKDARAFVSQERVQAVLIDRQALGGFRLERGGDVQEYTISEEDREAAVLTVSHSGDAREADVLFTTDFRPEVVGSGETWIWRSVTAERPITPFEASQMIEWVERGAPHEKEEDLPPVLRRAAGMPTLTTIAVVCQAKLADVREGAGTPEWWRSVLGAKETCLESMRVEWGRETEGDGDWEKVREFVETMFEAGAARLERPQIEGCLEALRRRFHGR